MESSVEVLQKLKLKLPYNPVTPLLGIYPKQCKSRYNREHLYNHVYYSTITLDKLQK
jgi:hypothetical protein